MLLAQQFSLPGIEINEKNIVSTGALSFDKVPTKLAVMRGLQGNDQFIKIRIPYRNRIFIITPGMDREISNEFQKYYQARNKIQNGIKS